MTALQSLPRKFKLGATLLPDPNPEMSLEVVHETLSAQFPMMRHTHIFDSDARLSSCGTFLEYKIVLPPVKTKG